MKIIMTIRKRIAISPREKLAILYDFEVSRAKAAVISSTPPPTMAIRAPIWWIGFPACIAAIIKSPRAVTNVKAYSIAFHFLIRELNPIWNPIINSTPSTMNPLFISQSIGDMYPGTPRALMVF